MAKKNRSITEPLALDAWEQAWQRHWKKAGFTSYELHLSENEAPNRERNFLMQRGSPEREKTRLKRITAEFERGFDRLHKQAKEVGFGRIVDSPAEAVQMVVRSLPPSLQQHLTPLRG